MVPSNIIYCEKEYKTDEEEEVPNRGNPSLSPPGLFLTLEPNEPAPLLTGTMGLDSW
jgi:hypothetical protein